MRLNHTSDTYLKSSLCWFLADTFVRHVTGPIIPTPEDDWTWLVSHPHTVLSIAVFLCPVIWLAWTPVFPSKVESMKTDRHVSILKQTNKKTSSQYGNLCSSGALSTHSHLPSLSVSVRPIQNKSSFVVILSFTLFARNLCTEMWELM